MWYIKSSIRPSATMKKGAFELPTIRNEVSMCKKTCHHVCDVVNDEICLGVCAMGIDPKKYRVGKSKDNTIYLLHPNLEKPLVQYKENETEKVKNLVNFVIKLTEAG